MILCDLWHRGSWSGNKDKPEPRKACTLEWEQNLQKLRDEVMVYSEVEYGL